MGKPLMIQPEDERRIDSLKDKLGINTKVDVVRAGLALLEEEVNRKERVSQWIRAVSNVMGESKKINKEFQKYSRLKRS